MWNSNKWWHLPKTPNTRWTQLRTKQKHPNMQWNGDEWHIMPSVLERHEIVTLCNWGHFGGSKSMDQFFATISCFPMRLCWDDTSTDTMTMKCRTSIWCNTPIGGPQHLQINPHTGVWVVFFLLLFFCFLIGHRLKIYCNQSVTYSWGYTWRSADHTPHKWTFLRHCSCWSTAALAVYITLLPCTFS